MKTLSLRSKTLELNFTNMILNGIFGIGGPEILIIALVVVLLFGGKKIPELMRGVGKGVRSFKEGLNDATKAAESDENTTSK